MPKATLDTDLKYTSLMETYLKLSQLDENSNNSNEKPSCQIFESILEGLDWLTNGKDASIAAKLNELNLNPTKNSSESCSKVNVVITGSLYLVGLSLKVLNFKID